MEILSSPSLSRFCRLCQPPVPRACLRGFCLDFTEQGIGGGGAGGGARSWVIFTIFQ